jgi:hypothetical protein
MNNLKIATVQFENKSGDKAYNLAVIENLTQKAAQSGAKVVAECRTLGNDFVTATLTPGKLTQAGGYRYLKARRPDLYRDIIGQPHQPEQKVVWLEGGRPK